MKILNLTNNETSDIKFEVSKFPDGQQQVKILNFDYILKGNYSPEYKLEISKIFQNSIQIKSRLNNFKDLELIICATKSLRNLGVKEIHLYTPYFLGSRSDRKFEEGSNNYLKDVICPIINSLEFSSVNVLDPHSDVLEACIKGFKKESNLELVKWALLNDYTKGIFPPANNNFILVSPDAGASKKIFKVAEQIGYTGDIITCSKERDNYGKLTRTNVPLEIDYNYSEHNYNPNKDFIIIDDICDGGLTFINIAKEILSKFNNKKPKIYLIVTHGIFSKGFEELSQYFDGIYCTNSYQNIERDSHFSEDLIFDKEYDKKVKQLNIF